MRSVSAALVAFATVASASPFSFPLSNGFPNPSTSATLKIEHAAHGSLPNGPVPASVSETTLTDLIVIAFNEIHEVAFFTELIKNITDRVPGYTHKDIGSSAQAATALRYLKAIVAQEELHALSANSALAHFKAEPIKPCKYAYPVSTYQQAVALASTFTDVVLGTLQGVQTDLANNNDNGLIQQVGSIIGQEGEQNGYFRTVLDKIPSALPFLTTSAGPFAFSAINQQFVVNGSCPNVNTINVPILKPLTSASTAISAKAQQLEWTTPRVQGIDYSTLSLAYINQQNLPIVEKLTSVKTGSKSVTFQAYFPYNGTTFGNGLTIAALVKNDGPFESASAVANASIAGPGLIEVN